MILIAGFDSATNVHGRNVRTSKRAIVHNLLDACSGRGDLRGKIGEPAGAIANDGGEPAQTAVGDETPLNHAAEHIWIDIAAAKQQNNSLAGEFSQFSGQAGGERRGGGA